jgi:hypothetical protein
MRPEGNSNRGRRIMRFVLSFALGLIVGGFFHYLLYRYSLPSKPFIYSAF